MCSVCVCVCVRACVCSVCVCVCVCVCVVGHGYSEGSTDVIFLNEMCDVAIRRAHKRVTFVIKNGAGLY